MAISPLFTHSNSALAVLSSRRTVSRCLQTFVGRSQQVRCLGSEKRGPKTVGFEMFSQHWHYAKRLFDKDDPALTHGAFKQRVDSLRVLMFYGLTAGLLTDLVIRPPVSSYWRSWSPLLLAQQAFGVATGRSRSPLFSRCFTKAEIDESGYAAYRNVVENKLKRS